jgi:hypothetical protein
VLASLLTTWVTFVPCFLFVLLGAPYVERLRGNHALSAALTGITAAVLGVIANLGLYFALHTAFATVRDINGGPLHLELPDPLHHATPYRSPTTTSAPPSASSTDRTEGVTMTTPTPPTQHELALMIWLAVFPTLTALNLLFGDWLGGLSPVVRTFALATIAVPIVIYGLMPQLHRLRRRLLARTTSS